MTVHIAHVRKVAQQANELLRQIGAIRRKRLQKEAKLTERMQALQEGYGPEIEELKKQEASLVDQLVALVVPNFVLLAFQGTKTIKLRSGEISLRRSAEVLEVSDDEAKVIRRIKQHGGLRKFTRVGKRTLNKEALKKAPEFVQKIKGIAIIRHTSVVIKPAKAQGEIVRSADTLSVQLTGDQIQLEEDQRPPQLFPLCKRYTEKLGQVHE